MTDKIVTVNLPQLFHTKSLGEKKNGRFQRNSFLDSEKGNAGC